jgi:hypothetical protein
MARKKAALKAAPLRMPPPPSAGVPSVRLEIRLPELAELQSGAADQVRALQQRVEELDRERAALTRQFDGAVSRIDRIVADLQPALAKVRQHLTGDRAGLEAIRRDLKAFQYEQLLPRFRTMVEATLPPGAVALVVSKGDERLLAFTRRTGWHFLRTGTGVYAGHHPKDSAAAIAALERLRGQGAAYLVIPQVAFWWLDHYAGFREHLDARARMVARHDRTAVIYALDRSKRNR